MDTKGLFLVGLLAFLASYPAAAAAGTTFFVTAEQNVVRLGDSMESEVTLTLQSTGKPADIDLTWADYPETILEPGKRSWRNFRGTDTLTIKV